MINNAPLTRERAAVLLDEITLRLLRRDQGNFGWADALLNQLRTPLIANGVQDFRLDEIIRFTGDSSLLSSPRTILDIGCGTAPLLHTALHQGHDAYGIDNDFEKISIAHLKTIANGFDPSWNERIILGDATAMPFADESFDVVTSYQVLEHIPKLDAVLYEAVRVTKRGGWLVFRAPDYRMSFEPHYRIPWPQFAPEHIAERWLMAMGRPPGGLGTFFYITLPQIQAIVTALGCTIRCAQLQRVTPSGYQDVTSPIGYERMLLRSDADIHSWALALRRNELAGTLDPVYATELNFVLAAQRM